MRWTYYVRSLVPIEKLGMRAHIAVFQRQGMGASLGKMNTVSVIAHRFSEIDASHNLWEQKNANLTANWISPDSLAGSRLGIPMVV
jgi:hypothetical protein